MVSKLILGLAVLVSAVAYAGATPDHIARLENVTVLARNGEVCSAHVQKIIELAAIPVQLSWFHADVTYQDAHLDACWAIYQDKVLVVDENGEGGSIPIALFEEYVGS